MVRSAGGASNAGEWQHQEWCRESIDSQEGALLIAASICMPSSSVLPCT